MSNEKYLQDIQEIRSMMDRSTRFISLSGLSGILAGVYALIGAFYIHGLLGNATGDHNRYAGDLSQQIQHSELFQKSIITAIAVLIAAIITAYVLTSIKAKKHQQKVWSSQSTRLITNFLVPLVTGGLLTVVFLQQQLYWLVAPSMLIFYGLACYTAARYTLGTVKYLGITCVILGLINTQFIGYGLYFWAAGFGFCHIIYGAVMYFQHDRKSA